MVFKQYINLLAITAIMFANALSFLTPLRAQAALSLSEPRPLVYRQLVPLLARFLTLFHIPPMWALVTIVTLAGVGYYVILRKLANVFIVWNPKKEWLFLGLFLSTLPLLFNSQQVYDMATLFLFTSAFYCLATGHLDWFPVVFIAACLNRETACLLILASLVIYLYYDQEAITMPVIAWEIVAFGLIQLSLHLLFSDNPGAVTGFRPLENIRLLMAYPLYTLIYSMIGGVGLYFIFHNWNHKPHFLRLLFASLFPVVLLLHFLFGWTYEIRQFAEVYPIAALLILPVQHA